MIAPMSRRLTRGGTAVMVAVLAAMAGCGAQEDPSALRIYTSLDLPRASELVRAEQLALADSGGRAGDFVVTLRVLSATPGRSGEAADFRKVQGNAARAVKDRRAIAYVGESNSDETAVSLPITNRANLLHVGPAVTYTGFTKGTGAAAGEPGRFMPRGRRTFGRVIPADDVQAAALVAYLRREGVRRTFILGDRTIYGASLADLVRLGAARAGVRIATSDALNAAASSPAGLGRALRKAEVPAMVFTGCVEPTIVRALLREAPGLTLYTSDCQAIPDFYEQVRGEGERVRVVAPFPVAGSARARAFARRYEARYGVAPGPQAYFAYDSVAIVLDAIRRAGPLGDDRRAVAASFFATKRFRGVVGDYAIDARGDTTLRSVSAFRIRGRGLVPDGELRSAGGDRRGDS
jgi:branched-chain amino acid transport system substrate-binding protein